MKKKIKADIIFLFLLIGLVCSAQTDPGTENLLHQWTFDDGTANDAILDNPVNGTLTGGATIVNKALQLSSPGQYLSFSGTGLMLNTYPVISQEIWYTPVASANTGFTMLTYFGSSSGGLGYDYISVSSARQDNVSRTAITDNTYDNEIYADGPEYDDGLLHHMVSVIRSDSVILYIDGSLIAKKVNTIPLSVISTSLALLGKGGYTSDPTWIGSVSKFCIYNKSLSPDEVKYLYQQGAEQSKMITSSINSLSFDEFYTSENISISLLNISDSIKIEAPTGIILTPSVLSPDITSASVNVKYDTTVTVDDTIIFSSDSIELLIPVKSYTNTCYSRLYPEAVNLITNPYISSLSDFEGWGNRSINSDSKYVYCGATSGKVTGTNGGSLDVNLTGKLMTSTTYRIKAKVYVVGGSFQLGIFGWSGSMADFTKSITITDSWQEVDFTITTGETLGASQGVFFNNYDLSGKTGYIDNWEMYALPKVYSSVSSLNFLKPGSKKLAVRGVNLSQDISITATDGFLVSPSSMSAGADRDSLTVTFDGPASTEGLVYFSSGSVKDSLYVSGSVEPILITSVSTILMDEINKSTSFTVTGYNLNTDITITAPEGILLSESSLSSTAKDDTITATYDAAGNSSGTIILTSGSAFYEVNVTAYRNEECFIPLYPEAVNLITDPTCNSYITDGWGNKSINTDPAFVFCGSRCGKVTDNGSYDRVLTGLLKPNTEYRVKAKVYKESLVSGDNMGHVTYTLNLDSASYPEYYRLITIAMDSACKYYSKYTPFIADIWVYYSSGIPTAQAGYHGSIGFGSNTRYMWVGTAIHEMAHYFGSGTTTTWQSLMSGGVWSGAVATNIMNSLNGGVINGDSQHFWPYGINQKEEITNLGSLTVQDQALIDAVKLVKAMLVDDCNLPANNPAVGIGVYGWDKYSDDIYHEVSVSNSWQDIDFTFTTGAELKSTQRIFFNRGSGYIDNWEMYEVPVVKIKQLTIQPGQDVYIQNNKLVTEIYLTKGSFIELLIYDIQGRLVYITKYWHEAGSGRKSTDIFLPAGIYIIKMVSDEFSVSKKAISY